MGNITSVSLRRNPWNKVLSKPFRITETSNCRRRGHLCRFHKKFVDRVACTMTFSLHSERWNVRWNTKNTLTESVRGFIFTCSYSKPMIIFPVSLCVRLKFLFLEHFQPAISTTSFPGSLFSASIVVEKRSWFTLVTCLPESGRFTKCVLGDGWQCRPCRHCEERNQHAIDFVARWPSTKCLTAVFYELHTWNSTWKAKSCGQTDRTPQKITSRYSSFHRVKNRISEEC